MIKVKIHAVINFGTFYFADDNNYTTTWNEY